MSQQETCNLQNSMYITNRQGNLPKISKAEFAELMLSHAPEVDEIPPNMTLVVEFPDGRVLEYFHNYWPADEHFKEELHEWFVKLMTLDQRTERCLRKFHIRNGTMYLAPFVSKQYKIDPSGKWSYFVW